MTLGHWHGYLWTVYSKDLKDESQRRPGAPGTPQAQEFLSSSLPPPAGKLDPARIAMWRERGYTFQIRNLDRWYPPLHAMCRAIQQETGFGCYVTAFVTPAGAQGLDYHWDQNIGIIYQAAGTKTWQTWRPVVEEPHRGYQASNTQPLGELVEQLKADGPDLEIKLNPGQVLVLPRGWVHNPHALDQTEDSVHLTFVIRERTGFWIGERLAKAAIESTALRRVIAPAGFINEDALATQIDQARSTLVDWLDKIDTRTLAIGLLDAARTELEPDYI